MKRAERLQKLHAEQFGGISTIDDLCVAAIDAGIFPPDIRPATARQACRRALSADSPDGLPYAMRLPRGSRPPLRVFNGE